MKGTLKFSTWHPLYEPFLDLTFRYGFTILRDFPLQRCTTRAKNDGLGNACRGPRCAGTATYFDSYQVLYMKQMVDAMQVNGKLGYVLVFFLISSAARFMET